MKIITSVGNLDIKDPKPTTSRWCHSDNGSTLIYKKSTNNHLTSTQIDSFSIYSKEKRHQKDAFNKTVPNGINCSALLFDSHCESRVRRGREPHRRARRLPGL